MALTIQIRTYIKGGANHFMEVNRFINIVNKCITIDKLSHALKNEESFYTLCYGKAGNHFWVRQLDINGDPLERLLIVKEEL